MWTANEQSPKRYVPGFWYIAHLQCLRRAEPAQVNTPSEMKTLTPDTSQTPGLQGRLGHTEAAQFHRGRRKHSPHLI